MGKIRSDSLSNPISNTIFLLRVDALYDLACTRVSGITQEKEYENIVEGGVNDYVHLREKPVSKPNILQIERYVGEKYFDPLPAGYQSTVPLVLYVGRYPDNFNHPTMTFSFSGITVISKKYGELDAEKGGLMVVTTEIAYQEVAVIKSEKDVPRKPWAFGRTAKKFMGVGKRRAVYNKDELRRKDMEENSRKWPEKRSARTVKKFTR
ncbi:MAG: hypothetical protein K2N73_11045 [Lachnospiraceae bacterium]|nr:hypothetical protein [Lachnospiraceae bacterium]